MLKRLVLRVCLPALLSLPILAQDTAITYKSTELAPGLYMLEGVGGFTGGNLGLSIGDDGVVLIDDGVPSMTPLLRAAVATITGAPVEFVINTHVHGDHMGGNEALAKNGATIVAHDNMRKRLVDKGMAMPDGNVPAPKSAFPVLTFSESMTFHLNGREAFVFHVEHAHTDGDAVIRFPADNVIHAGDVMFNGLFPFIDLDSGGSVDGYIAAQKRMLALADDKTRIIPGHGPLASKTDLAASIAMLEDSRKKVQALIKSGRTEDEILAANPLAPYEKWSWQFINTERMTRTLYRDLK